MDISRIVSMSIGALLASLAITHLSCHGICSRGNQDFQINLKGGIVTISPDKDSIQVGDTLWLNSVIPTKLVERYSNGDSVTINFNGASNVRTDFHITVPVVADSIIGGIDSFGYFSIIGTIMTNSSAPNAAKTVNYIEKDGSYQLAVGIIAQKKGVYALSFIDIYQAEKKCVYASIEVLMNNADNHIHYLDGIHYPGSPYGDTIYPIERTHTYCFKVY